MLPPIATMNARRSIGEVPIDRGVWPCSPYWTKQALHPVELVTELSFVRCALLHDWMRQFVERAVGLQGAVAASLEKAVSLPIERLPERPAQNFCGDLLRRDSAMRLGEYTRLRQGEPNVGFVATGQWNERHIARGIDGPRLRRLSHVHCLGVNWNPARLIDELRVAHHFRRHMRGNCDQQVIARFAAAFEYDTSSGGLDAGDEPLRKERDVPLRQFVLDVLPHLGAGGCHWRAFNRMDCDAHLAP